MYKLKYHSCDTRMLARLTTTTKKRDFMSAKYNLKQIILRQAVHCTDFISNTFTARASYRQER